MEKRLTELETKVAFLEDSVNQLDQVIYEQRNVIDRLKQQFQQLTDKHEDLMARMEEQQPTHEVPPHY